MDDLHDPYRSQIGVDEHQFPTYLGSLSEEISLPSDVDMELLQEAFLEFIGSAGVLAETDNELEVEAEHVNHMLAASAYNLDNIKVAVNHLTSNARLFTSFETLVRSTIPLLVSAVAPADNVDIVAGDAASTSAVTDASTLHTSPAVELEAPTFSASVDALNDTSATMNTSSGQIVADSSSAVVASAVGEGDAVDTHSTSTEPTDAVADAKDANDTIETATAAHGVDVGDGVDNGGDGSTHDVSAIDAADSPTEYHDRDTTPEADGAVAVGEEPGEVDGEVAVTGAHEGHAANSEDNENAQAALSGNAGDGKGHSAVEGDDSAVVVMNSDAVSSAQTPESPIANDTRTDADVTAHTVMTTPDVDADVDVDVDADASVAIDIDNGAGVGAEVYEEVKASSNTNPSGSTGTEAVAEAAHAEAEVETDAEVVVEAGGADADVSVIENAPQAHVGAPDAVIESGEGDNHSNNARVNTQVDADGDVAASALKENDAFETDAVLIADTIDTSIEHTGAGTTSDRPDVRDAAMTEADSVDVAVDAAADVDGVVASALTGVHHADSHTGDAVAVQDGQNNADDYVPQDKYSSSAAVRDSNGTEYVDVAESRQAHVAGDGKGVNPHVGDGADTVFSITSAGGAGGMGDVASAEAEGSGVSGAGQADGSYEYVDSAHARAQEHDERGQHDEEDASGHCKKGYRGQEHDIAPTMTAEEGDVESGVAVDGCSGRGVIDAGVEGEDGYVDVTMPLPFMSNADSGSAPIEAHIGSAAGVRATPTTAPHTMGSPHTPAPHARTPYADISHTPVQQTHASHASLHLPSTASPRAPLPTCPPSPPAPVLPLTSDVSALHRAITELQTALTREREMRKRKEEDWNQEKTRFEEKIRDLEEKLHDPSVAARVRLAEEESQVLRNQLMMTEDEVARLHREIGVINGRVEKEKERSVRAQETMGEKMMENERLHERISELEHEKRELLAVQRANLHQVECLEVDLSKKNEQLSHANEDAESLIREMGDVRREVDVWKGKAQERGTALEQACMQYYNSMGIRVRFDWDEEGEWSLASADPVTRLVLGSVMGNTNTPIVGIDDSEVGNINTHLSTRAYSSGGNDRAEETGTGIHTPTASAGAGTGLDHTTVHGEQNADGVSMTTSSTPTTPLATNPTGTTTSSAAAAGGASNVIPPQTFTVGTHVLSSLLPPPPPSTSSLPLATQAAVSRALFEQKTLFLHFFPFLRLPTFGYSISEASRVIADQSNTISRLHTAHENELVTLHEELETHRQSQTDYSLIIRRLADDAGHSRAAKRAYSLILKRVVVAAFMARVRSRKMAAELYRMVVALLSCLLGCLTAAAHSSSAALPVDLASLQIHTDAQNVSSALSNITHPRTALHKSLTLLSTALALATPAAAALGGVCERQLATIGAFFKRNIALAGRVDSLQGALERLRGGDGTSNGSGSGIGVGGSRRRDDAGIAQAIYDTNTYGYGNGSGNGAFDGSGSFDHPAGSASAPIRTRIAPPTVLPVPSPTSSAGTGASGYNHGYPANTGGGSGSGGGGFSGYKGPRTRPPSAHANTGSNGSNSGYGYPHGAGGMGDRHGSANAATYNNNNASMSFSDDERRVQHGYSGSGASGGNSRNGANSSFSRTTPIQSTMSGSPVRTRTRPSTASTMPSTTRPSAASKPVPYNPQLQQNNGRNGSNFGTSMNSRGFPEGNSRPQTMADVHAWTQACNSTRDHAIYGESDLSVIVDDDLRNTRRTRPVPAGMNNTQTQLYTHNNGNGNGNGSGGADTGMARKPVSSPLHPSHTSPSRPSSSTAVSIPFSHPYALRMSPTQQQGRPAPPPPNGPPAHVRPVTASRNMRPTSSHRRAAPNGSSNGGGYGNEDGTPNASTNGNGLGRLYGLSAADDEATKRGYVNTHASPPSQTHTTGMEGDRRDMIPKPPPGAAAFIRRMK